MKMNILMHTWKNFDCKFTSRIFKFSHAFLKICIFSKSSYFFFLQDQLYFIFPKEKEELTPITFKTHWYHAIGEDDRNAVPEAYKHDSQNSRGSYYYFGILPYKLEQQQDTFS